MKKVRHVLLLGGSFSGLTASLAAGFRARGCVVHQEKPSLRRLRTRPLYLAAMAFEALATYGTSFRRYMLRTRLASRAFGLAGERTVSAQQDVDLVVQIGANHAPFVNRKRPGTVYTVFTDHTNLLSKQLPDYGLHFPERLVSSTWNTVESRNLMRPDHVFVLGTHVKRSMEEDYGIPGERITAVGAGPNLDTDIERAGFRKPPGAKNVLFVGLDAERKGLPVLKTAFAKVREFHPDATLHVVGVEGVDEPGIVHYGKLQGDALKQRFYEAQIFAMPSLREPFGAVFVEAMWAKAVCIGTNIGAIPEIITEGRTGFVVEPNEADVLAERIVTLFDQPELRAKFAERAYADAKRRFTWDVVLGKILDEANRLMK